MSVQKLDTRGENGLEKTIAFLKKHGVKAEIRPSNGVSSFSRVIDFEIYGVKYHINWFINQSKLCIGEHKRCAELPFIHLIIDRNYPMAGGNLSLAFSYTLNKPESIFDREYPYEVFRIPLEI